MNIQIIYQIKKFARRTLAQRKTSYYRSMMAIGEGRKRLERIYHKRQGFGWMVKQLP